MTPSERILDERLVLPRALEFVRRGLALAGDDLLAIDGGWVVRTPSLPEVWNLNSLRLSAPVAASELEDLARSHLAHLPYAHVVLEDDAAGQRLEAPSRAKGWRTQRELLMAYGGPVSSDGAHAERTAPARMIIEPSEEEMLGLMSRWIREEFKPRRDEADQLLASARREGRRWNERRLGIRDGAGSLAAMTKLRSDGSTAQIEDVYTAPQARERGFARTLVSHATELALDSGHELVLIVADDDNWPKLLYSRLGFEPIGRTWAFHRDARASATSFVPERAQR